VLAIPHIVASVVTHECNAHCCSGIECFAFQSLLLNDSSIPLTQSLKISLCDQTFHIAVTHVELAILCQSDGPKNRLVSKAVLE
jgi:hypothetical protein